MTNVFSKLLEKIVQRQMLSYIQENNLINANQFGFLPGKSRNNA